MTEEQRQTVDEILAALRRGDLVRGVRACGPWGGELSGEVTDPYSDGPFPADVGEEDQSAGWDGAA